MRLQTEHIDGIKAEVNESNARHFYVVIDGPGGVSVPLFKRTLGVEAKLDQMSGAYDVRMF